MSSQDENVAAVRAALALFQSGDIDGFLEFLDPDIEVFSTPELANPTHARGREAWLRWAGDWLEVWETFEIEAESIEAVGEHHVILDLRQHGKGKGSGVEVELRVYYMFELHDGVATRYHLYPDREQAEAAALAAEGVAKPSD
jgi:ketosteroid isomerase-like protein